MSDVRSVKNTTSRAADEHVESLRQKIGTEFTDRKSTGKKKNELGKDDFMKLMSAQLKYQDPISPMKNEEMAAQLAQFSALEQMVNVNQNLEKMTAAHRPQENMMAASLIGKRVATDSSRFSFQKGQSPDMKFEMPKDSAHASLSVVDAKGEIIREYELGSLKRGPQSVKWDGKNSKGQEQADGEFSFRLNAVDNENKAIQVGTNSTGLVNGVVFEQGKALLLVDGKKIPMDVVGQIESGSNESAPKNQVGTKSADGSEANNLTNSKQNISTTATVADNEKSSLPKENILQSAAQPEKIKQRADLKLPSQLEPEEQEDQNGAFPLWNPSSN